MALPLPMDLDKRSMRMALSCRSKVILYSLNAHRMTRADLQRLIDDKTKPIGSLGRLESLAVQAAAILGAMTPSNASASLTIFAADHGIAAQRVSAFPQEVTGQMVANFLAGGAAANVIAAQFDIPVTVVDCGIAHPPRRRDGLIDLSLGGGTADSSTGPAMSPETARKAIAQGRHFACGIESKIVCFGEMGIANTSAAALLAHKLSGISVAELAGALAPIEALADLGGFEIGTMAGAMVGAGTSNKLVVVDGFIATAAAALARAIEPDCERAFVYAHRSAEHGHRTLLDWLEAEPLLDLDMRLGEGTGALLAVPIIHAALSLFGMASFSQAGVSGAPPIS